MSDRLLTISGPSLPARTLAYLASPYTFYPEGIEFAFREASRIAATLLLAGVEVYSPIAHCHPMSLYGDIDALDRDFWLKYQETMMARCDVLIVAEMKGWKESIGIAHEIKFFLERKRTIFQLDPVAMNMRRVIFPASEVFERSTAS
jgi:Domain of unknown function (DUF1937).